MRCGWPFALLLFCAGCATKPAPDTASDYELFPRFVWPEWTPTTLGLIESTDVDGRTMMIIYPRRRTDTTEASFTVPAPNAPAVTPSRPPPVATSSPPAASQPSDLGQTKKDERSIEYVELGKSVTFAASADGSPPLSFEWRKNGQAIPGETAAQITIKAVRESDAGTYDCIVKNPAGRAVSEPVTLVVRKP